jgi:hypothetical protein
MSSYNPPNLRNLDTFNKSNNKSNKGVLGDNDNYLTDIEKMNLLNMYNDYKFSKPFSQIGNHLTFADNFFIYENIKFKFVLNGIQLYANNSIINGIIIIIKYNDSTTIEKTYKTSLLLTGQFYSVYDNDLKVNIDIYDEFNNKYYKITIINGWVNVAYTNIITNKKTYNKMVIIEKII